MTSKPVFKNIDLDSLKPDSDNPRMPKSFHGKSDEEMISYLLLESSLVELMQAIGENDFFPGEQLLVVHDDKDDKYVVIEGNRRLTAVRLLNDPSLAKVQTKKVTKVFKETKYKPDSIPCLIFPTRDEILKYLGYRHITGIQTWKLLEKARYLKGLQNKLFPKDELDSASRKIAKIIGSRMDYVRRLLVGFDIYKYIEDESFFQIPNLNDTTFHFNYIADSLNKEHITEFLGIDFKNTVPNANQNATNIQAWAEWLFVKNSENQTRLKGTSSDLSKLNNILGNSAAFQAFKEGSSLARAYQLTNDMDNIFYFSLQKSLNYLEQVDDVVHRVDQFYSNATEDLRTIYKLARKIKNTVEDFEDDLS